MAHTCDRVGIPIHCAITRPIAHEQVSTDFITLKPKQNPETHGARACDCVGISIRCDVTPIMGHAE